MVVQGVVGTPTQKSARVIPSGYPSLRGSGALPEGTVFGNKLFNLADNDMELRRKMHGTQEKSFRILIPRYTESSIFSRVTKISTL